MEFVEVVLSLYGVCIICMEFVWKFCLDLVLRFF